ncbi:hypothetical protein H0A65_06685 [Alcaligenaceae bacterium]|nr:hypothetical protein [Alcaligenaceae bacterium]
MKLSRREMLGFSASLLTTMISPVWAQAGKNADGKRIMPVALSGRGQGH